MAAAIKPGPKRKPLKCRPCNGSGTVPVNPNDRREGDKACPRCGGSGEVG